MHIRINGEVYWLWRAVDQDNNTLDILVTKRRDKRAAKRFFKKLLKSLRYVPRVIITDKLPSYGAAKREILPGVEHRQHKGLNNQVEISHQPTRQQQRQMRNFKSPKQIQRFLSVHFPINNLFRCRRHRLSANEYRQVRDQAFETFQQLSCAYALIS